MIQRQFTKDGLEKLKKELEELRTVKRREIARRLHETTGYGDLSENSEYQEAKEAQVQLEARIAQLETVMKTAVVVPKMQSAGGINIGSKVTVSSTGGTHNFILVGTGEAAPWEGKISVESPLGKALLRKQKGDTAEIDTPGGKRTYKIIQIA